MMELHMHSHRLAARTPDWTAAAVSGFAAGAVLMVLELIWAAAVHADDPWAVTHQVAAIAMGQSALQSSGFAIAMVAVALATHYVLGILFGLVLAAIIAPFHLDSSVPMIWAAGVLFGVLIYLFDFYGMVGAFPWFAGMRGWSTFAAHLVFGMAAAVFYWQLERTR